MGTVEAGRNIGDGRRGVVCRDGRILAGSRW